MLCIYVSRIQRMVILKGGGIFTDRQMIIEYTERYLPLCPKVLLIYK